jgi:hypothetical protein
VEYISTKIGIVLLALGGMHFFNMFNFANMRSRAKRHDRVQADLNFIDQGSISNVEAKI